MCWNLCLLIIGLVTLTLGAEGLVRGSASLATRIGVTPLIIGLTVVAFGTSSPELVVSVDASLSGHPDIAIGNVVGSNIFNIGIILGITALLCPVSVQLQVVKHDGPIMIAVSILASILIAAGALSWPAGIALLGGIIAYTALTIRAAKKETALEVERQFREGVPPRSASLYSDLLFIGGGLLLLIAGSRLLVVSATNIARLIGISEAVIALTIIAAGTSLPELATSAVAALRRQPDIAVGNIVGSNIFNILAILGAASIVGPLSTTGITHRDLWVMVAFSIGLLPLLYTGLRLQRWEGALLLIGYGAYLRILWPGG